MRVRERVRVRVRFITFISNDSLTKGTGGFNKALPTDEIIINGIDAISHTQIYTHTQTYQVHIYIHVHVRTHTDTHVH